MTFRQKCVKHVPVLGAILVVLQVLLSSNYDLIKTGYSIPTSIGMKYVLVTSSTDAHLANSTRATLVNAKTVDSFGHEGHNGFELAAAARSVCRSLHISSPGFMKTVHAIPNRRVMYCPMEKIATTFWRRVFYMLVANDSSKYKQPYDVPISKALGNKKLFTHSITRTKSGKLFANSSFSFLFVRNPYSRLLSAFIDKLVPPNPTYWNKFGVRAITHFRHKYAQQQNGSHVVAEKRPVFPATGGHDVTFAEFLKFVVSAEKSGRNSDAHFISINKGCKPCTYPNTYIGKMETFQDDALFIMKKLQMNKTIEIMGGSFRNLSIDDAITDSIRSPFSWKKDVMKYISWEKALQRVWLKLQMRGIIERSIKLKIANDDIDNITVNEIIEMARKAHRDSDPVLLKKQKDKVKREAFASVPLSDVKAFRETFKQDFALFGYDPSPSYMFDRGEEPQSPTIFFNYDHLN